MAAFLTSTFWKQCKIVNDIIEVSDRFKSYNAIIVQKISIHFPLFSQSKRCEVESIARSESLEYVWFSMRLAIAVRKKPLKQLKPSSLMSVERASFQDPKKRSMTKGKKFH